MAESSMGILQRYKDGKVGKEATVKTLMATMAWNARGARTLVDMVDKKELCREEDDDGEQQSRG